VHPLARFVTEDAVALMFNITIEQIDVIECWRHIVYVHAKGVSRFVSYADFPPILVVAPPNSQDFLRWRKRWRKRWDSKNAPDLWNKFYIHQFQCAISLNNLFDWGKIVSFVKSVLSAEALQKLREVYSQEKYAWEKFANKPDNLAYA
jgi:hypothetical protein